MSAPWVDVSVALTHRHKYTGKCRKLLIFVFLLAAEFENKTGSVGLFSNFHLMSVRVSFVQCCDFMIII